MDPIFFLKILTIIVGLYMAWNIGANDVANAMGTSVGSRALTMKQAVFIAAVFEFSGAFFAGSHVSQTIQKGIVNVDVFNVNPMVFAIGMISALLATAIWLNTASFFKMPVSTTHAIVGAVLGFGSIIGGIHAIHWKTVFFIASSWIISPILSGIISYGIFYTLQKRILFALNPLKATRNVIPFCVFGVFFVFTLSFFYKGQNPLHLDLSLFQAFGLAMLMGVITGALSIIGVRKIPKVPEPKKTWAHPQQFFNLDKAAKHLERTKVTLKDEQEEQAAKILQDIKKLSSLVKKETKFFKRSSEYSQMERSFGFLQILSACLVAFAHGANDVANAIGPVAGVLEVLRTKIIATDSTVATWILLLGGFGIVLGLATWGWRVIQTIGKKITALTPTRGFSAEFGAALTILLASKLGMPISTTHALVGGVLGVGLARGIQALNLRTLREIVLSWVVTIPLCALFSIIIFYLLKIFFI